MYAQPIPKKLHLDRRAGALADQGKGSDDDYLSTSELATWLGVTAKWLANGRVYGWGPPFLHVGGFVKYRRGACRKWLLQRYRKATAAGDQ
jgi:hypothetical protein